MGMVGPDPSPAMYLAPEVTLTEKQRETIKGCWLDEGFSVCVDSDPQESGDWIYVWRLPKDEEITKDGAVGWEPGSGVYVDAEGLHHYPPMDGMKGNSIGIHYTEV